MTHMRTTIRHEMRDVIAAIDADWKVYASRKYARNIDPDQVLVDITVLNENIEQETMGDERVRDASLYVRLQRAAPEEDIDDLLDSHEVQILAAIDAHDWSSLLEEDPELVQVNFSDDADGGYVIAAIILRFDLEYRVGQFDPETISA